MKQAFTIKELILFGVVIVLIGVFIIPILEGKKEYIDTTYDTHNLSTCIQDIKRDFLSHGIEKNNSLACKSLNCFGIDLGDNLKDGKITILERDDANQYCYEENGPLDTAEKEGFVKEGIGSKVYKFGGKRTSI